MVSHLTCANANINLCLKYICFFHFVNKKNYPAFLPGIISFCLFIFFF